MDLAILCFTRIASRVEPRARDLVNRMRQMQENLPTTEEERKRWLQDLARVTDSLHALQGTLDWVEHKAQKFIASIQIARAEIESEASRVVDVASRL